MATSLAYPKSEKHALTGTTPLVLAGTTGQRLNIMWPTGTTLKVEFTMATEADIVANTAGIWIEDTPSAAGPGWTTTSCCTAIRLTPTAGGTAYVMRCDL